MNFVICICLIWYSEHINSELNTQFGKLINEVSGNYSLLLASEKPTAKRLSPLFWTLGILLYCTGQCMALAHHISFGFILLQLHSHNYRLLSIFGLSAVRGDFHWPFGEMPSATQLVRTCPTYWRRWTFYVGLFPLLWRRRSHRSGTGRFPWSTMTLRHYSIFAMLVLQKFNFIKLIALILYHMLCSLKLWGTL